VFIEFLSAIIHCSPQRPHHHLQVAYIICVLCPTMRTNNAMRHSCIVTSCVTKTDGHNESIKLSGQCQCHRALP